MARVWDQYLSEQDRAHIELHPARRKGVGERPALVLVDLYRWAFGDRPEELLESVKTWPGSCGMAGWQALPHIQRLLAAAREVAIPVVHLTGLDEIPGWRESTPRGLGVRDTTPDALNRRRQRYDIVEEVAPVRGEPVLQKAAPSAFFGTPLAAYLNGLNIDTVLVAGESTSGCVRATVVDGRSYRFNMVVVEECVFDRHEAAHAINLFDMDQKYADVVAIDEALAYMRGEAVGERKAAAV